MPPGRRCVYVKVDFLEVHKRGVKVTAKFDVWSAGMTMLCVAGWSLEEEVEQYETREITSIDDPPSKEFTRYPEWGRIKLHTELTRYVEVLEGIFDAEKSRGSAEDVTFSLTKLT